jgi:predicted DNA-binding transcriptional regulator YafY
VDRRTVERDVAKLVAIGIPIDSRRGPSGGYMLDAASRIEPVPLTAGEVAALLVSLAAVGPTLSATAQSAAAKLIAALHEPTGE